MIEVKNISKSYGLQKAIEKISFDVKKPEVIGLVGPNGAGKSTTMNILTGYLASDSGSVKIMDYDMDKEPVSAKKNIGYLPEVPALYPEMTVIEYLYFVHDLKKVKEKKKDHVLELMKKVKIDDVKEKLISSLSRGYRQRVGLAAAIMGYPKIIILDEPTAGLDPKQVTEVRELISNLSKDSVIIVSSHILSEIETICDRVLVLKKGKLVADNKPDSISKNKHEKVVFISVKANETKLNSTLKNIKGIKKIEILPEKEKGVIDALISTNDKKDIRSELSSQLIKNKIDILEIRNIKESLEEAFLNLVEEKEGKE